MAKMKQVYSNVGDVTTPEDAMNILARMPYRDLLDFAALIRADVDHIATALDDYFAEETDVEAIDG